MNDISHTDIGHTDSGRTDIGRTDAPETAHIEITSNLIQASVQIGGRYRERRGFPQIDLPCGRTMTLRRMNHAAELWAVKIGRTSAVIGVSGAPDTIAAAMRRIIVVADTESEESRGSGE